MKIELRYFIDGWRARLVSATNETIDTTTDVYPTAEILLSRIRESKTWFENLEETPSSIPKPYIWN